MKVLKFGGTSLANCQYFEKAARLVDVAAKDKRVVVVASAVAGTTNRLVALIEASSGLNAGWTEEVDAIERQHLEILATLPSACREPAARSIQAVLEALLEDLRSLATLPANRFEITDRMLAVGERLSVQLFAAILQSTGCAARVVDAADAVVTDSSFGKARVDLEATRRRCRRLFAGRNTATPIVTGFIGADPHGRTTTLGRGGSDLTAAVLGAALDAERVEIWTDVDGVLTAPPQLVPSVSSIPWLSYEEAAELSFFGAKVLHPQTVHPLAERGIPIHVRNTLAPGRRGTEIAAHSGTRSRVVAASAFKDVTAFRLRNGSLAELGEVLMSCRASADGTTLVAVPSSTAQSLIGRLQEDHHFAASVVTLVGHDIALQPWVAGRALESLARRGIVVRSFAAGASPHTVALLVDREDLESALCTIHDALMLDREILAVSRNGSKTEKKEIRHVSAA
jgi:aspartokinase/homoserine dehydrogenase 1